MPEKIHTNLLVLQLLCRVLFQIKQGQFELNHMVASLQTFLVFMDFHVEFSKQELMVPFRLACFATKYKEDLFPINNGHSKPFQSSNKLIKWSLTLELSDSSN